ncbi:MAG: ATP-binding protein [Lachnospiraceae bacterium]|nr:ATP-binding protein [Lachnospiraceae bacterium]
MKRACEVAVSGMHNFLMVGAPGSGKTMTARAIPSILPPLSREEELSIASIYSICGKFGELSREGGRRPFRSPHHSISTRLLSGGGSVACPGELTLSHKGVLFLDELTEFNEKTLEVLRQPLEDGWIKIYHDRGEENYPADFMLVCAMNAETLYLIQCKPEKSAK